jgi:hypothetical protein
MAAPMSAAPISVSMWGVLSPAVDGGGGWSPVLRFGSERPGHRAMVDGGFGSCVARARAECDAVQTCTCCANGEKRAGSLGSVALKSVLRWPGS